MKLFHYTSCRSTFTSARIRSRLTIWLLMIITSLTWCVKLSAQSYQQELDGWYQIRTKTLAAENGWLNLVGLYWLEEGQNSFGSGERAKIKFPENTIPAEAGYFELNNGIVTQYAAKGVSILVDGQPAPKAVVFDSGFRRTPVCAFENLRWTIIKRGTKIGIRLRNLKSPAVTAFKGIDHFPADQHWIVPATLHTSTTGLNSIAITNVLGQVNAEQSPGKLHFSIGGKEYVLDALEENDKLFIIFADATSGESTYPSGRFLLAEKPGADGKTTLDFNKAYNPPCAFSDFATCPLPPRQNVLPFAVTAGEKTYSHHE